MSHTAKKSSQLQPCPITLSCLHLLDPKISSLHTISGIELSLPESKTGTQKHFRAIVSESTNRNLLLKSFYDSNVRGKLFDGTKYLFSPLADHGISRCAFTSTFGVVTGQPTLNDTTAPQFKVDGVSRVPFTHQGYFFSPAFFICDHIFCRQEYETQFVAVLSLDFLCEYFIRAQLHKNGWRIQLPRSPPAHIGELLIYTDGCCLFNGHDAGALEAKPAQGGYGIHFPNLPSGWDMYGALSSSDSHTNQKAELTAVIRALQLVRLRKIPCTSISIFTDSKYAVQGLNEWIPNLWRLNGYRTSKNRVVVNADLFKSLDEEFSISIKRGVPVTISHVPREQNKKADALSKLGAVCKVPLVTLSSPIGGSKKEAGVEATRKVGKGEERVVDVELDDCVDQDGRPRMLLTKGDMDKMKPLVQWTPDCHYWVKMQPSDGPNGNLESSMEMLVV